MLTLYGSQGSGSAAIEMALRACDLTYRVVRASTWEADSAREALAKLNPLGQIPTLQLEDGSVLTESAAILIHLGLSHPSSGLLPPDASARAQTIRGLVFIAANCYSAISVGDYPERWTLATAAAEQDKVRQAARTQLHSHWAIFADTFDAAPYLGGVSPSALDYLAVVVSKWSGTRAYLGTHRAEFLATLQRIEANPIVASVIREHWPQ